MRTRRYPKDSDHQLLLPLAGTLNPHEYKVISLRECGQRQSCWTADRCARYWRQQIQTAPYFNPDQEFCFTLLLDTHRFIKGHTLIAMGSLDAVNFSMREVFRAAIVSASSAVVFMHNHPSGEVQPSPSDVRSTRRLIDAAHVIQIQFLDHVIMGRDGNFLSMRAYSELKKGLVRFDSPGELSFLNSLL